MTKYRLTILIEFETDKNLPDFSKRGTIAEMDDVVSLLPDPNDVDKEIATASVLLTRIPDAASLQPMES